MRLSALVLVASLALMGACQRGPDPQVLAANAEDVAAAKANGLEPAMVDRLTLSAKTVESMAEGVEQVIADLERKPQVLAVGTDMLPILR